MILHSIVPVEQIMQQPETMTYAYRQQHNSFIQGVESNGNFTVSRLISTNPKLYLDPQYTPGQQLGRI